MRIKVHRPQPLADPKLWRWELVDEADRVLASSPDLDSEAQCENAVRRVEASCKGFEVVYVDPPRPSV
jgi:hypothetical protein